MVTARLESNLQMVHFSNLQPNLFKVELISVTLVSGTQNYSIPSRVVMILDAYVSTNFGTAQQTDRYVSPISRTEFASLANKASPGQPSQYWFQRTPPNQLVSMYPVPDASGPYTLNYYACSQMQDTNLAGGETPDIPYLWLDAYVSGLAYRFARVYKPELETVRKADAKEAWDIAAAQNTENVSFSLSPQLSSYFRR